jgi:hypothetical protein
MINLISPKQSFADFCQRMLGKDPPEVLSAASAEIS